tara:strand:+ start:10792 stop:11493 length:702 start_codon:yes stop_codon:yes gene_type:complete
MSTSKNLEKNEVKDYFNGTGFDRWKRIYSQSDDVNTVQKNIRKGHQKTVDDVIAIVKDYPSLNKLNFCDAGCGVGSLAVPLLKLGVNQIQLSDISYSMVNETRERIQLAGLSSNKIKFKTCDLENLTGDFDCVICLDVFIHYPQEVAEEMVKHLCNLSKSKLIVSFAPYTPFLAILKNIGKLFPGPSKTTRAYTLKENGIINAAKQKGFNATQKKLNQAPFYFSKLIEFEKIK